MSKVSFPEMYERWLAGPLFRPFAELTLAELQAGPGDRILDVACGTGIVARAARERLGDGGRIVGIDVSKDMLAVARAVEPGIDWRQGDAAALPLREGERFDVVVCQQGLQFFADRPPAAAQMRRALAPGGRLAVSTWRPDAEIPFLLQLRGVAERHLGFVADRRHSFGEAEPLGDLLLTARFLNVRVRTVVRTVRFGEGGRFLRMNAMALVAMSAAGQALAETERQRVVDEIVRESRPVLESRSDGTALAFEIGTNLATATV